MCLKMSLRAMGSEKIPADIFLLHIILCTEAPRVFKHMFVNFPPCFKIFHGSKHPLSKYDL